MVSRHHTLLVASESYIRLPQGQGPHPISDKTSYRKNLVKSRIPEIIDLNHRRITLKFDRLLDSTAVEVPVKFQSDPAILSINIATSRLFEILQQDVLLDIETRPWMLQLIS